MERQEKSLEETKDEFEEILCYSVFVVNHKPLKVEKIEEAKES